jgi:probable lipoprotein NlpC
MPPWLSDWVGTPYADLGRTRDGADCLGLYLLLNKHRLGRNLPDPGCTIQQAMRGIVAMKQRKYYDQVTEPQEGDALLIRRQGFPVHVGYCINHAWMIHTTRPTGAVVDRWNGLVWRNRIVGIYRYVGQAEISGCGIQEPV